MSYVVDGKIVNTAATINAKGGTELMRSRLISNVNGDLLNGVAINFSRFEGIYANKINILYAHDLPYDPMYENVFKKGVVENIDMFVFVSHHQKDLFLQRYEIPYSKIRVIPNAIGDYYHPFNKKNVDGSVKFIYHTTPHRGLELVYPIFEELDKHYDVHLDVFSSFELYGWGDRDKQYEKLFNKLKSHENIKYHGAKDNKIVVEHLQESHVFLYPCIWHETSCLALMEAIQNGCICVHPDYGALPETARGNTIMIPMDENPNVLVNKMYNVSKYIMDNYNEVVEIHDKKMQNFIPYSLAEYSYSWNNLIKELKHGRNLRVSKE